MLNLTSTVFVVGPDASVRASLETAIFGQGLSPRAFACAEEFFACPTLRGPSCLVLTVPVFDLNELDLLRRVTVERRETTIIVVTANADISTTVQAMKAGAAEFLMQPVAHDVLLAAIVNAIVRSRTVLDHEAERLTLRNRYDSLSQREREVMARVVAGQLNKLVGAALGICEITVKAHRGRVMRKMGAESLAQLVTMAMRLDIPTVATAITPLPWPSRVRLTRHRQGRFAVAQ
jgi:FixJ family two-component response regulator